MPCDAIGKIVINCVAKMMIIPIISESYLVRLQYFFLYLKTGFSGYVIGVFILPRSPGRNSQYLYSGRHIQDNDNITQGFSSKKFRIGLIQVRKSIREKMLFPANGLQFLRRESFGRQSRLYQMPFYRHKNRKIGRRQIEDTTVLLLTKKGFSWKGNSF